MSDVHETESSIEGTQTTGGLNFLDVVRPTNPLAGADGRRFQDGQQSDRAEHIDARRAKQLEAELNQLQNADPSKLTEEEERANLDRQTAIRNGLVSYYLSANNHEGAIPHMERQLEMMIREENSLPRFPEVPPGHSKWILNYMSDLSDSYIAIGRYADAQRLLLELLQDKYKDNFDGRLNTLQRLGACLSGQSRFGEAERYLTQALQESVCDYGEFSPEEAQSRQQLGRLYRSWGRHDLAYWHYHEGMSIQQMGHHPHTRQNSQMLASTLQEYAEFLEEICGRGIRLSEHPEQFRQDLENGDIPRFKFRKEGYSAERLFNEYFSQEWGFVGLRERAQRILNNLPPARKHGTLPF